MGKNDKTRFIKIKYDISRDDMQIYEKLNHIYLVEYDNRENALQDIKEKRLVGVKNINITYNGKGIPKLVIERYKLNEEGLPYKNEKGDDLVMEIIKTTAFRIDDEDLIKAFTGNTIYSGDTDGNK